MHRGRILSLAESGITEFAHHARVRHTERCDHTCQFELAAFFECSRVMAWRYFDVPPNFARPIAWRMIRKDGSSGDGALFLYRNKLIGEDFERSR